MKQVTIDTNCLIDLEEKRSAANAVRALHKMHQQGAIRLRVVAVSASERRPDGEYAKNFNEFQAKLASIGFDDVEILKPILYWGISFWGYAVWSGPGLIELEKRVHTVLFPQIEFGFAEYCSARGVEAELASAECAKWRNAKCDVLIMWAHIHYGGDVFVSRDSNFFKSSKKPALEKLGANAILMPSVAVEELQG